MDTRTHPDAVLMAEEAPLPSLPTVDHYAGSERLMHRALALQSEYSHNGIPAIDVTLDCEDGAAVGNERAHAERVAALVMSEENQFGRVGARIHGTTHPCWLQDLEIIVSRAGARLAYLTLPKARGVDDVRRVLRALEDCARRHAVFHRIGLHVLIETPGALRQVWDIAALDGVHSLDFGLMDFVSAHHGAVPASAMQSPGQFDHPLLFRAKTELVAAALAHGVLPTHNVTTELQDTARIRSDALRARHEFGFLRMWSIHPQQIEAILGALQPAHDEISEAGELLTAAQDAAWGPIQRNGKLHDRASYRYYWSLLKRAQAIGCEIPSEASRRFFQNK